MNNETTTRSGMILALLAATLWGISGACAQMLFQQKGIDPGWLVTIRLLIAGLVLLAYSAAFVNGSIWTIWKTRRSALEVLAFAIFGMLAVQYTYFAAISHSNAATGTVLQYLGPTFIAIYYSCIRRRLPSYMEAAAIALALLGTLLLVTHGDPGALQITALALFWGIASALALAFYTIQPVRLLKHNDPASLTGWSMTIGGLAFIPVSKPWVLSGTWDMQSFLAAGFIIVFGTLIAFYTYLAAVKKIGPQKTSLLACAEPVSAAVAAVLWLGIPFGLIDWIGSICIVATIFILSRE
jgi:drug/metabolite transporter (DMT)-like permease